MQYAAVMLGADGGIIRNEQNEEVANTLVGDFETLNDAIHQACLSLDCSHLYKGVLRKNTGKGGFMVVTTQELAEV